MSRFESATHLVGLLMVFSSCTVQITSSGDGSANILSDGVTSTPTPTPAASSCQLGTTWTIVDDYALVSGQTAQASAMKADSHGNLYVAGIGSDGVNIRWIVRKSSNGGTTWSVVDNFLGGGTGSPNSLAVDSSGNVFVAGTSNANARWVVRKSADLGTSWTTSDDYSIGSNSIPLALGVNSSGNLFAAGRARISGDNHWKIRTSSDSGVNWTEIDDFVDPSGGGSSARAFVADSLGNLFAGGTTSNWNDGVDPWLIRKSSNAGTSWSSSDEFNYAGGTTGQVNALAVDFLGNLFAGGSSDDGSTGRWIVRKSIDAGVSWTTRDDFVYSGGTGSTVQAFGTDSSGNLYVVGVGSDGTANHWVVRKTLDYGSTWTASDDYASSVGISASPNAVTSDSSGNLYVSGSAGDSGGVDHWIVRKLACQ